MTYQIKLKDQTIEYSLRQNMRSGTIRLSINGNSKLAVSAPKLIPQFMIKQFLISKQDWILNNLAKISIKAPIKSDSQIQREYIRTRPLARKLVRERLEYYNKFYGFKYNMISIRNQSSRWGSCSTTGTLSFNYRIALIEPDMADYVIVHELCHTKEMNHSPRFYALMAKTLPHYKMIQRKFKGTDLNAI